MNINKETKITIYLLLFLLAFAVVPRVMLADHCLWVDEARDLFIARNFVEDGSLTTPAGQELMQHPFMFYAIIGASFLFGVSQTSATFAVAICSLITIVATFFIGKEIANKWVGFGAGALLSAHYLFLFYSVRILNNIPHTMFVTITFLFFVMFVKRKENKFLYLSFLFAGCAVLTRITSFFLPVVLVGYVFWENKYKLKSVFSKKMLISYATFAGIFATWLLRNLIVTGTLLDLEIWVKHVVDAGIDTHPWYYYLSNFFGIYTWLFGLLFVLGAILFFVSKSKYKVLLSAWFLSYFIILSNVSVKVPRYLNPTLPVMAIIIAFGTYALFNAIKSTKPNANWYAVGLLIVVASYLLFVGYTSTAQKTQGFCGFEEISDQLKGTIYENRTIYAGSRNQMAWYLNQQVNTVPEKEELVSEIKKGDLIEADIWERTQKDYIFDFVANSSAFLPIAAHPVNNPQIIVYERII